MYNKPFLLLLAFAVLLNACRKHADPVYLRQYPLVEAVYASGKIVAGDEYSLYALSNGQVEKKLVKEGDTVQAGQVLYVIANDAAKARLESARENYSISSANRLPTAPPLSDLRLSLESANIKLHNDSLNYFRWKRLWDKQIGSKSNLDNSYSNYQLSLKQQKMAEQQYMAALNDLRLSYHTATSTLATAREDLRHCYITSKEKGIVYQTFKESGEAVRSNEVVALMGKPGSNYLRLAVDQQDINRIRPGQQVLVQADITGNTIFQAKVTRIYPVMNEADQTFRVDAGFSSAPPHNFIHAAVEANIIIQQKNNALVLPLNALLAKDSIYVLVNGKQQKTWIRTGIQTLDYVEILEGIDKNTPVIPAGEKQ